MLSSAAEKLLESLSIEDLEALLKSKERKSTRTSKKVETKRQVIHHRHCILCGADDVVQYCMTDITPKGSIDTSDIIMDVNVTSCKKCYENLCQLPTLDIVIRAINVISMMQREWRGQKMPKRREGK